MKPVRTHRPGPPADDEPPARLVALLDAVPTEHIIQSGLTTTGDGRWALYVTVPADADVPLADVEASAGGYPVVYEAEPNEPPRAGPAYPKPKRKR